MSHIAYILISINDSNMEFLEYLKGNYFTTYTCNPVNYEYAYILNIDTVEKLHQAVALYTLGISFEEIKDCLEKPL